MKKNIKDKDCRKIKIEKIRKNIDMSGSSLNNSKSVEENKIIIKKIRD